jgi:hypothetical protein
MSLKSTVEAEDWRREIVFVEQCATRVAFCTLAPLPETHHDDAC